MNSVWGRGLTFSLGLKSPKPMLMPGYVPEPLSCNVLLLAVATLHEALFAGY